MASGVYIFSVLCMHIVLMHGAPSFEEQMQFICRRLALFYARVLHLFSSELQKNLGSLSGAQLTAKPIHMISHTLPFQLQMHSLNQGRKEE